MREGVAEREVRGPVLDLRKAEPGAWPVPQHADSEAIMTRDRNQGDSRHRRWPAVVVFLVLAVMLVTGILTRSGPPQLVANDPSRGYLFVDPADIVFVQLH